MIRYAVIHRTRFRYDAPVRFARCNLRLRPIDWDGQRVEEHALAVEPAAGVRPALAGGYPVETSRLLVERPASQLVIESRSRVAVERPVPSPSPDDPSVAAAAAAALVDVRFEPDAPANYLYPSPLIPAVPAIADWCGEELRRGRGVVEAGLALAQRIAREFRYDGSATTLETTPAQAFAERAGVCQDFAQVMISGARSAGLAAAYVSGYLRTVPPPGQARLVGADATHAWVMLWCGDMRGWVGFDPTNGVTVGKDHIVTAVGRDYGDVAPIDGVFLGREGQRIEVSVDVEPLD